jgi:hypothetical protein
LSELLHTPKKFCIAFSFWRRRLPLSIACSTVITFFASMMSMVELKRLRRIVQPAMGISIWSTRHERYSHSAQTERMVGDTDKPNAEKITDIAKVASQKRRAASWLWITLLFALLSKSSRSLELTL